VLSSQSTNTFAGGGALNASDFAVDLSAIAAPVTATVQHGNGPGQVTLSSPVPINSAPIQLDNISTLTIIGGTSNDTAIIDFGSGNPVPSGSLTFDGGDNNGADTLLVQNAANLALQSFNVQAANDGAIVIDDGQGLGSSTINYHRIRSVVSNVPSSM